MHHLVSPPSAFDLETKPIRDALSNIGFQVSSIERLRLEYPDYGAALDVIAEHVQRPYSEDVRDALARLLATPHAKRFRPLLIDLFRRTPEASPATTAMFRFGLAVAIADTTDAANLGETIALLKDSTLGQCRVGMLSPIRRRRNRADMIDVVAELKRDPQLAAEISTWR